MIILRNVIKAYGSGKQALSGVTLTVPNEDFVFLVGGNGAGKSTLLKLLIRQEVATSGVIMVAGHDLKTLPDRRVPAFRPSRPWRRMWPSASGSPAWTGGSVHVTSWPKPWIWWECLGMPAGFRINCRVVNSSVPRSRGQSSGPPRSSSLMNQPQVSHPTFPGRSSNSSVRSIGEE